MTDQTIGICNRCHGRVTVPEHRYGVVTPRPTCQTCGAVAIDTGGVIPMERPKPVLSGECDFNSVVGSVRVFRT